MANASSRREVLGASAALAGGAGAALIASCGGGGKTPSTQTVSTTQMQSDAAILASLLDLERSAVVAYDTLAARLTGAPLASARSFAAQERAHAAALDRAIGRLGAPPSAPKSAVEYRSTFPPLSSAHDALAFALDVENTAIGAYADALGKLATPPLRVTLASILATESEHAAVLLGRLRRPPVPAAFVTGPPPQQDAG